MRPVLALALCCGAGAPVPPELSPAFLAQRGVNRTSSLIVSDASALKTTVLDLLKVGPTGAEDEVLSSFGGACRFENYGYLAPKGETTDGTTGFQSKIVQFDIKAFSPETTKTLDLKQVSKTDDDSKLEFYMGCFVSGEFGYLVPGKGDAVRFNLKSFTTESVEVLDLKENMQEYHGGFAAGGYGYLVPYGGYDEDDEEIRSGKVVRFDLATFKVKEVMDTATKDSKLTGFHGGFSDGTYGYLVPYASSVIARFPLSDFDAAKVETIDLSVLDQEGNLNLLGFRGGFIDGDYAYLVPGEGHNMVRFTLATFKVSEVKLLDLSAAGKDVALQGFDDAFVDPYGVAYLAPDKSTKVAKVTLSTFADATPTVEALDIGVVGQGYMAAFADTETGAGYMLPTSKQSKGKVVRLDDLFQAQPTTPAPSTGGGGGGGGWWIIVVILLLAAGGGAGYFMYQQKQGGGGGSSGGTEMTSGT